MQGKDRAWHINRLHFYADRLWSMAATANLLNVDRKTVAAWAKKYSADFSNYDRAAAKNRTIWFAQTAIGRWEAIVELRSARELRDNPPSVSGALLNEIEPKRPTSRERRVIERNRAQEKGS